MNLMKHILMAFVLYLVVSVTVPGAANAQQASLLWKIEGNGLNEPSWLYGTQHLMCGEDFLVSGEVLERLKASDVLALEIDLSDPAVQQQMMQLSRLPDGTNIAAYIDEEKHEDVDRFLASHFGSGLGQLGSMKPITLTSMVISTVAECEQSIQSHDIHLAQEATELGIEVRGLETVEFQFELFDKIPLDQQVDELVLMILDPEAGRDEFRSTTELYIRQDIDGLYNFIIENEFWKTHRDLLLDKRNRAWISKMQKMSDGKSVFYAVGAGHLSGENGVINLLRESGYILTPVSASL